MALAFNSAWALLKDSATKEEYRANPWDEPGMIGAMDFDLNPPRKWTHGTTLLHNPGFYWGDDPKHMNWSLPRVHPISIFNEYMRPWRKGGGPLPEGASMEANMALLLGRTAAHEATHAAMHSIDAFHPTKTNAHEYGAYAGEPEAPMAERFKWMMGHPEVTPNKGLRDIQRDLKSALWHPDKEAQIMGNRARMNAQNQIDMTKRRDAIVNQMEEIRRQMRALRSQAKEGGEEGWIERLKESPEYQALRLERDKLNIDRFGLDDKILRF